MSLPVMTFVQRRGGLRTKLAVLLLCIMTVLMIGTLSWRWFTLCSQTEREMLQNTQVLAQEMDAVWQFMERNEGHFEVDRTGVPVLYCVVAAKSISHIFTHENTEGYSIHYTNFTTRKSADAPDAFEVAALEAFRDDASVREYYALTVDEDGRDVFRYAEPLYVTESCLKCHGEPAGEIDMVGYPKEGMREGDIAGCASIVMPAETYLQGVRDGLLQDAVVLSLILAGGLLVIYFGFSRSSRQIEKMNEALEAENRRQSDFLSMMSHEIRTPLTSICAFADIWSKTNDPRSPEEGKIMAEMRANSQVLLGMVNNILDVARLNAGRFDLVLEPVEVSDLVGAVVGSLKFLADKKEVAVETDVPLGLPLLMMDYEKARRMLENLLSNAVKFVDTGGKVKVVARYDEVCTMLRLCVLDDGCGIGAEDAPYVFDRFVQAADGGHRSGGSGLGLALVREFAELHGGDVELTCRGGDGGGFDEEYRGCAFTVRLRARPCADEEV